MPARMGQAKMRPAQQNKQRTQRPATRPARKFGAAAPTAHINTSRPPGKTPRPQVGQHAPASQAHGSGWGSWLGSMLGEANEWSQGKMTSRVKEEQQAYYEFCRHQNDEKPPEAPTIKELPELIKRVWAELRQEEEQAGKDEQLTPDQLRIVQADRVRAERQQERAVFRKKQRAERFPHIKMNKKVIDDMEGEDRNKGWVAILKIDRLFAYPDTFPALARQHTPKGMQVWTGRTHQAYNHGQHAPSARPMHSAYQGHIGNGSTGHEPGYQRPTYLGSGSQQSAQRHYVSSGSTVAQPVGIGRVALDAAKGAAVAAPLPGNSFQARPQTVQYTTAQPSVQQASAQAQKPQQIRHQSNLQVPQQPTPQIGQVSSAAVSSSLPKHSPPAYDKLERANSPTLKTPAEHGESPPTHNNGHHCDHNGNGQTSKHHSTQAWSPFEAPQHHHDSESKRVSPPVNTERRHFSPLDSPGPLSPQKNWQYCANSSPRKDPFPHIHTPSLTMPEANEHLPRYTKVRDVDPVQQYEGQHGSKHTLRAEHRVAPDQQRRNASASLSIPKAKLSRRDHAIRHVKFDSGSTGNWTPHNLDDSDEWSDYRSSDERSESGIHTNSNNHEETVSKRPGIDGMFGHRNKSYVEF